VSYQENVTMQKNEVDDDGVAQAPLFRAAQYVRMSTEHQQYSTQNQADKIREYAAHRGIEIVKTYADDGKSGLSIGGRASLQRLIADVESGETDFTIILVYDVSRWGRFQDADESAYYEYICRRAGIQVAYCAEQFENDGSQASTIIKSVKRVMAGEYSRELSVKVFAGQCRLIELGFRQGGPAGYGLRRVLIDQSGSVKTELSRGEHKSLQTDRVILMPGPDDEVQMVNLIYRWFIDEGLVESAIAVRLNDMKVRTDLDREWTRATVHEVLTNEKYIGNNVFNRTSFKLKKIHVINPQDMWIKKEGAFEPIVPPEVFYTAQGIVRARTHRYTDENLIERLRQLYQSRGILSGLIINETEGMPSAAAYSNRFGSLFRAYQMVGFTPDRDYSYLEINRFLRQLHPGIVAEAEVQIAALGGAIIRDPATDLLDVNNEFTVSIVLARCHTLDTGRLRWKFRFDTSLLPDITVAVRLDPVNQAPLDYYLLPRLDFGLPRISLAEQNAIEFECYRFDTLEYLYFMAARTRLRRSA
jgi:DNA invertase Pin-like site-specific DNA recombinase